MRKTMHRVLSVLLAASLLTGQIGYRSYAEETATEGAQQTEAPAPQTEPPAPQTEPPAPQTEPPAPQTEPPAPQTEPPAPQTEAPAPQTEAPAPQTEAPAPQTEAPAPQTEMPAPQTEGLIQDPATEAQTTETAQTEKIEPETEAKEQTFKAKTDFGKVVVKLSDKDALPKSAKLKVTKLSDSEVSNSLRPLVQKGHRVLTGVQAFAISLEVDGKAYTPSKDVRIRIDFKKAQTLGLDQNLSPKIAVFSLAGSPAQLANIELEQDENGALTTFRIIGPWTGKVAAAGIANRANNGEEITRKRLVKELGKFPEDYAAVTGEYDGTKKVPASVLSLKKLRRKEEKRKEKEAASEEKTQENEDTKEQKEDGKDEEDQDALPTSQELEKQLEELKAFSLLLANGVSTDEVKIVNLYAGEDGSLDEGPLKAVRNKETGKIDLKDHLVVINIIALREDQELKLPVFACEDENTKENTEKDAEQIMAGRILYNLTALGDEPGTVKAFKGTVSFDPEEKGVGTYLAAEATVKLEKGFQGNVFSGKLEATDDTKMTKALLLNDPVAEREAESEEASEKASEEASEEASEKASEEASEKASEKASEEASEEASEKASEEASEKASEEASEKASEEASEKASEEASEKVAAELAETAVQAASSAEEPEAGSEAAAQDASETAVEEPDSEDISEAASEDVSEAISEDVSEAATEEETESVTEGFEEDTESVTEEATEPSEYLAGLDEDAIEQAADTFEEPEVESIWQIAVVKAEDQETFLEGLTLTVLQAGENAEEPAELFTLTSNKDGKFTLDDKQTGALDALFGEDTQSVELQIRQEDLPEGYLFNQTEDGSEDNLRKVTVTKDEETGAYVIDPEEVLFVNVKQGQYKLTLSAVEKGKEDELAGACFTVTAGGSALVDSNGDPLEDLEAGDVYLDLESNRETNEAVKAYLDALDAEAEPQTDEDGQIIEPEPPVLEISVKETKAPWLFELPETTEQTFTVEDDPRQTETGFADEWTAKFEHETKKELVLQVKAVDASDKTLPGAAFSVTDKDSKDMGLSGQTASDVTTYKVVPADLDAFKDLDEKTTVKLLVNETKVPSGYVASKKQISISAGIKDGVIVWEEHSSDGKTGVVSFPHNPRKVQITLQAVDNSSGNGVAATFGIKDGSGNWIGSPLVVESDGAAKTVTIDAATYPELASALASDSMTLTAVQITTDSSGKYTIVGSAEQTVKVSASDYDTATGIAKKSATFKNRQAKTTDTIRLRKEWYVGENSRIYFPKSAQTFYAALFSDAEKTKRVSGVYSISAAAGNPYKTKTISYLASGTYYVAETDQYGTPVSTDSAADMYVTYAKGGGSDESMVKIGSTTAQVHNITMKNHYKELPDGGNYVAMMGVRKVVRNENGEIDSSFSGSVKARVIYKTGLKTYKQEKTLTVSKGTSAYVVFYIPLGEAGGSKKVNIYELNGTSAVANGGTMVLGGSKYTAQINPETVTVSADQSSTPLVLITNTKMAPGQTESEETPDDTKPVAELKLTKKVTYKNVPMHVNAVFYIGIFDDANLTKLRYKKPMQFKNASSLTASLKINLYKLKSQQVTFYFAEVDKDGKPVKSGKSFGYNVTYNKSSITLNKKNLKDEFIVTNDIPSGSKKEQQLTDPSSGFAGDASAVAEAQEIERTGNSAASTNTGDETPVGMMVGIALGALAAVILLAVLIIVLVRKNRRQR